MRRVRQLSFPTVVDHAPHLLEQIDEGNHLPDGKRLVLDEGSQLVHAPQDFGIHHGVRGIALDEHLNHARAGQARIARCESQRLRGVGGVDDGHALLEVPAEDVGGVLDHAHRVAPHIARDGAEAELQARVRCGLVDLESDQVLLPGGVDGHRADIVILKTARSHAAWAGRLAINEQDILLAAELALPHRLKRQPFEEAVMDVGQLEDRLRKARADAPPETVPQQDGAQPAAGVKKVTSR